MNFCFTDGHVIASKEVYVSLVDLAMKVSFEKQAVSRSDRCKGRSVDEVWSHLDYVDENNTLEMAEHKIKNAGSTNFWTLRWWGGGADNFYFT